MIQVPDNTISQLVRHLPMIISQLHDIENTRLYNAVRLTKKNLRKLEKLNYEHKKKKELEKFGASQGNK